MLDATPSPKVIQVDYETNWWVSSFSPDSNCFLSVSGYGVHVEFRSGLLRGASNQINLIFPRWQIRRVTSGTRGLIVVSIYRSSQLNNNYALSVVLSSSGNHPSSALEDHVLTVVYSWGGSNNNNTIFVWGTVTGRALVAVVCFSLNDKQILSRSEDDGARV